MSQVNTISLDDGEYVLTLDGFSVTCTRKGEPWQRDFVGDKLTFSLVSKVLEQRAQLDLMTDLLQEQRTRADLLAGTPATAEQIEAATEIHGSEEIEIDDDARVSEADDGYWMQAWVWVAGAPMRIWSADEEAILDANMGHAAQAVRDLRRAGFIRTQNAVATKMQRMRAEDEAEALPTTSTEDRYRDLDVAIVTAVVHGGKKVKYRSEVFAEAQRIADATERDPFNVIGSRMTDLRRKGAISYVKDHGVWILGQSPTNLSNGATT